MKHQLAVQSRLIAMPSSGLGIGERSSALPGPLSLSRGNAAPPGASGLEVEPL